MAIVKVFFEADMRLGIPGLNEIAKKKKSGPMASGFLMFMNKKKTMAKIIWAVQYMLTLRKEHGKITMDDLRKVPSYFKGEMMTNSVDAQVIKYIDPAPHEVKQVG
jgi:hypothetical protein